MGMMVFPFFPGFRYTVCPINLGLTIYWVWVWPDGIGFGDGIGLSFSFFHFFHLRDGGVWRGRALMTGGLDIYDELGVWWRGCWERRRGSL